MYILQGAVSLEALIKAQKQLESALDSAESDLEITGTIKCFEYCYELSWKTMRKILEFYGIEDINSPRKVFAAAFLNNLITDLDLWNSFIEKRNLTPHTYNSTLAHTIFESLDIFYKALIDFIHTIEKL